MKQDQADAIEAEYYANVYKAPTNACLFTASERAAYNLGTKHCRGRKGLLWRLVDWWKAR